ncbi:hypothetical protein BDV96DRAFT_673743 [Lophiotrema nucula]|uniref:Uncharacterized protein n=1 Tax=Lophiotrema nucula TaxID=690887 RepID=A0A6A5YIG8_9PLEO|nr:hypothetical protein BDV96DRAFT_673743 [Lophiotrema nucula]
MVGKLLTYSVVIDLGEESDGENGAGTTSDMKSMRGFKRRSFVDDIIHSGLFTADKIIELVSRDETLSEDTPELQATWLNAQSSITLLGLHPDAEDVVACLPDRSILPALSTILAVLPDGASRTRFVLESLTSVYPSADANYTNDTDFTGDGRSSSSLTTD